jgi:hypothetical protein
VRQHITRGFHSMHTRVRSYSWSGGPYSHSTAVMLAACIRLIRGQNGMGLYVREIMLKAFSQ